MSVMMRKTVPLLQYLRQLPRVCQYSSDQHPPRGYTRPQYNRQSDLGPMVFEKVRTERTDVEISTEEWKYVENILPKEVVPELPKHESYPTPSGWFPPTASPEDLPYWVRRTRYHNFPVYHEILAGGSRKMTVISKVEGDIWALEAEVRKYIEEATGKVVITQVDEVCCKVRVRGTHLENVAEFLKEKGL